MSTSINDDLMSGGKLQAALFSTDASGNVTGLVGPDGGLINPRAKTGARFLVLGDSITAQGNNNTTITAMSRVSNIVTVTATNHGLLTGRTVKVANSVPDSFNGIHTITRIDANSYSFPSVGDDGAATLSGHPSGGAFGAHVMERFTSRGWWQWLLSAFNGGLVLAKNLAFGGWKAEYAADYKLGWYEEQIAGDTITDVCIAFGINDCLAGNTVSNIVGDLQTLCEWGLGLGCRVWLETIKPVESGYSNSTNINELVAKVNRELRDYARDTGNVYLVDTYSAVVNPATGHCTAGLTADNIHPNEGCARAKLGPAWYAAMNGIIKPSNPLAMGVFDNVGADADSRILWDYGPWANTSGGTTAGTVSGDVAANFKVEESGSGSVAASIAARTDGFGYDQVCEFTAAANNDLIEVSLVSPTAARFLGKTIQLIVPFELTGNTAGNVKGLYSSIAQTVGGVTNYTYSGSNASSAAQWGTSDDTITGCMITPPVAISSDTTAIQIAIGRVTVAGAGTSTLKVGRITVLDVSE